MFIFAHHPNYRNGQRDLMPFSRGGETEAQSKKVSADARTGSARTSSAYNSQALSKALPS